MPRQINITGRLVQGSLFNPYTKDSEGKPLLTSSGQPRTDYFIAVAVSKSDPRWPEIEQAIKEQAAVDMPNHVGRPNFSYKIADGDGVDDNGKPNAEKPGFAGHWVLRMKTGYAPKVFGMSADNPEITDPNAIKLGDYIEVACSVAGNRSERRPGVYLNYSMVKHRGYGEKIIVGPNPNTVFGASAALPAGASATPVGGAPMPEPAPAAPPPAPVAPAAPTMTSKAEAPYEAYRAQGWTDDLLRQHGYMV